MQTKHNTYNINWSNSAIETKYRGIGTTGQVSKKHESERMHESL